MLRNLLKGAGVVALGTAIGQGVVLLATPYFARTYTPAQFGQLALLASISNIAAAVGCLRYDLAIPGSDQRDARPLVVLCTLASAGIALATAFGLTALTGFVQLRVPAPFDSPLMIGACILLVGLQQAALGHAIRRRAYKSVAGVRLLQGVSFTAMAALPMLGLVWSHVLSFVAALPVLRQSLRRNSGEEQRLGVVALSHREFPLQSLPGAVLDVVGFSVCVWVLTGAYGNTEAGHFSQVQRIVGAPLMLVGISIGQVLLRHSADLVDDRPALRSLLLRILKSLGLIATVTLAGVSLAGEPVLHSLLGAQWRVDTEFLVLVAIAVLVRACVSPLSVVLVTLRRFDLGLAWQFAYFVSALALMPWIASSVGSTGFLRFYALHECLFYFAYLAIINFAIKN